MKFTPLLTVLFIGLKLTGHIDWSWGWVISPMIISLALHLLAFIAAALKESME